MPANGDDEFAKGLIRFAILAPQVRTLARFKLHATRLEVVFQSFAFLAASMAHIKSVL